MILLKQYWQYLVMALLAVVIIILLNGSSRQSGIIESQESIIREKNSEITYRKNKEGKTIADKEAAEARAEDLEKAYPKLVKVLTDEMDIRIKNLRTSIQAEFRAMGSGSSVIIRDTVFKEGKPVAVNESVKIDDGFLSLSGSIQDHTLKWGYSYQDSITIALHVKKKWLLGNEKLYSSFYMSNPNAKVINSTSVLIKSHRDKRWIISLGVTYDPIDNKVRPGIHAGYALFKF